MKSTLIVNNVLVRDVTSNSVSKSLKLSLYSYASILNKTWQAFVL